MRMCLNLKPETAEYLVACARLRGLNPSSLVRRLLDVIAADVMVASVLDDRETMKERRKGEQRYRLVRHG